MARVATANLSLGTWSDGENPGAGTQAPTDSTGLNGNFIKLDTAVGTEHTSAGAHKTNVIDGPNLKTTVADASTIELAGAPLKLGLKALGITAAYIAAATITAAKLANACIDVAAKIVDGVITGAKLANATVTQTQMASASVGTSQLIDANVTAAKLGFKLYAAQISQSGTNAPTATVIVNTLGVTPSWIRVSAGLYGMTSTGAFPLGKTSVLISNGTLVSGVVGAFNSSADACAVLASNFSGTGADGVIVAATIEVKVFP